MRSVRPLLAIAAATIAIAASVPAALAAPPAESGAAERGTAPGGFIYWSDGYLAVTGDSLEAVCAGEPDVDALFISPGNGSSQTHLSGQVPVIVFDFPEDDGTPAAGFLFLDENCPKVLDGDPSTVPAAPVASGEVRLRAKFRVDANGVTHSHNSLVGQVTTTSGAKAHLSTFAQVLFDDNGLIDLKQLTVKYTG